MKALAKKEVGELPVPVTVGEEIERILIYGDLSRLNPEQRVTYYRAMCESYEIPMLVRPFDFLVLSNKLTLYANKSCAQALSKRHAISTVITSREHLENGIYCVTARASAPNGRTDEDMGTRFIGDLKGKNLENALMAAVTKAKRRAILSICGLTMMDETEVDSVEGAVKVSYDKAIAMPVKTDEEKPAPVLTKPKQIGQVTKPKETEPDWSKFTYCYELPEKKRGTDMAQVRQWLDIHGFKYRAEDNSWYGNTWVEKLSGYSKPTEHAEGQGTEDLTFEEDEIPEWLEEADKKPKKKGHYLSDDPNWEDTKAGG